MATEVPTAPTRLATRRRLPIGAECQPGGGVHFRVWAPRRKRVAVVLQTCEAGASQPGGLVFEMAAEADGYFSSFVDEAGEGSLYRFQLDDEPLLYPDPASRFQPEGVHGPSQAVDPTAFAWQDVDWKGVTLRGQVCYELHIGTFTPDGTFEAAQRHLPHLAETGVTLIEVMPVAEFAGQFGWGYDGVDLFAPTRLYGFPDDLRAFVDAAHRHGLGVILDVVYNHFGPLGNYIGMFSRDYFSTRHGTDWGEALNFDGPQSAPVREFISANAGYWIDEYHLDGLRLDAVHAIYDDSPDHILAAVTRAVRKAARGRGTLVIAENESQDARLVEPSEAGGYGLDAVWNDDFHHAARVAMTGHNEFYYADYRGTPQELLSAIRYGYLYQGQWNARQKKQRGTAVWNVPAERFVVFLQNHDQVANSGHGWRSHALTSPGRHRAMTAVMLLAPGTPLLFQGQEFSASAPFLYFADHDVDLAKLVREGRQEFLRGFRSLKGPDAVQFLADPSDPATFQRSKLHFEELNRHRAAWLLHRDLLKLRRTDPVFAAQRGDRIHGAVLGSEAFLLRYLGEQGDDRLLLVNLGCDLKWLSGAEPLLAPPRGAEWKLLWSSEDPRYEGSGTGILNAQEWYFPGHAAIVMKAEFGELE